jgi:hypothetical protein
VRLTAATAGGAITVGSTGDGLLLTAATLAALQGFGVLQLGDGASGALSIDTAVLTALTLDELAGYGSSMAITGRGQVDATVLLASRGDLVMAAGSRLATADHPVTLRAAGALTLAEVDAGTAGVVLVAGGLISDADNDSATNIRAGWLVMRGLGPVLAPGQSSNPAAIDVEAARIDLGADGGGVVLRDTGADGRTRYNLLQGGVLYQLVEASGESSRAASGGDSVNSASEAAAWLNAVRPLSELRDGDGRKTGLAALRGDSLARLPEDSAAALYLATLKATPLEAAPALALPAAGLSAESFGLAQRLEQSWLLGSASLQPAAGGLSHVGSDRFDYWEDSLAL